MMHKGIILSDRKYPYLNLVRKDDNIFFTALSMRIIKDFQLSDHVIAKAFDIDVFDDFFEIINGTKLYQFWKRRPNAYFPNGWFLHRHDMFKPPPEADTTALIYYIKDHSESEVDEFFKALRHFANVSLKTNHNAASDYRDKKIFSTWFGSGRMPIEFDFVVLINLFYSLEKHDYPMDDYYRDSLFFVKNEVDTANYIARPFYASPWYASSVFMYYNIARFIYFHPHHELASLVPTLLGQLDVIRLKAKSSFDHMLVNSALMFLGTDIPGQIDTQILEAESRGYSVFLASMLALLPGKIAWKLAKYRLFHLRFVSYDYNQLLIQENLAMRKIRNSQGE